MKVYVLTAGEYSDYHIVGVALDRKKAERISEILNRSITYSSDEVMIEEYDTDKYSLMKNNSKGWLIDFHEMDHSVKNIRPISLEFVSSELHYSSDFKKYSVSVFAEDEQSAIKSASDKLAKWLAEKSDL